MNQNTNFLHSYPAVVFSLLTILFAFASYLLPIPREGLLFVLVLIPALVAVGLTGVMEGKPGVNALLKQLTRWRIQPIWIGIALGLALVMRLAISLIAMLLNLIPSVQVRPISLQEAAILVLILMVAAIPEELGWRGFALSRMLKNHPPWFGSLMIGVMWGCVHLILHLPGMPSAGLPGLLTVLQLVGLSVLLTWFYIQGSFNVILCSVFHAAQSFFVIVNDGISESQQMWLMTGVYCVMGLIVLLTSRVMRKRLD